MVATLKADSIPLALSVLRRADDALILGHRLSEWCGHAPTMEEDMALTNVALDHIGQARSLYSYAADVEDAGNDEDRFAYLRDVGQYRNLLLVEQPNGDFAHTIVRQFLYSAFADPFWRAMVGSTDQTLAAIAAKSEKESAYHLLHATEWMLRLGDGTNESRARAQAALENLFAYCEELFYCDDSEQSLIAEGVYVDPESIRPGWLSTVTKVLAEAGLSLPAAAWHQKGGRVGIHSEHLGHLLSELQYLQRSHPGARW